jgi:subtilisin family serine protease
MRKTLIVAALPLLAAVTLAGTAVAATGPDAGIAATGRSAVEVAAVAGPVVPGEYIVTLRPGAAVAAAAHRAGVATRHTYTHALTGFAATLTAGQLRALRRDADVQAIEPNQVVHALTTQSPTPNWGLDRIDQRTLPLNNAYTYFAAGAGVTAYVIDTGIDPTHPDFGGRAAVGYDATGGNGIDCNGHGTHVAGILGAKTYGVAKSVRLLGVRVLNCQGSGTFADVIEGVDWVSANSPGPAVANMSLGGSKSAAVDTAVNNLAASGVFVAVAGGGSGTDACNFSPGGASGAFTVAASDRTDHVASFNNTGPCIKLYAPGVQITSLWLNGTTATLSGSSMSAPHTAGVAALYKSRFGDQPTPTVTQWLISVATVGVLIGVPPNTPNRLLYTNLI